MSRLGVRNSKYKYPRNTMLEELIFAEGLSLAKWCEKHKLSLSRIGEILNNRYNPIDSFGKISEVVLKFCEAVNLLPEDIWSYDELRIAEVSAGLLPPVYAESELDLKETVEAVLETLPLIECDVLIGRFFEGKTLEELAEPLGVTRERVRQIEVKAIKHLRSRHRWPLLSGFVGGLIEERGLFMLRLQADEKNAAKLLRSESFIRALKPVKLPELEEKRMAAIKEPVEDVYERIARQHIKMQKAENQKRAAAKKRFEALVRQREARELRQKLTEEKEINRLEKRRIKAEEKARERGRELEDHFKAMNNG